MRQSLLACLAAGASLLPLLAAQESATAPASKPTEHLLGTISAVDSAAGTITVKDDKTSQEYVVSVKTTRTLLKVSPGSKDLKTATRISAGDLAPADRVDIRGFKSDSGANGIEARSVVLMSARDLQQKHQADAAAWENSIAGVVSSVDPASRSLAITARLPDGPKPITVHAPASVEFTRYSPQSPKTPAASTINDVQPGDQVRIIGQQSDDGSSLTAEKVYSGAFRTVAGTVTSISADGSQMVLKDLQTKQPVTVSLTSDSSLRKLPPEIAMRLARRAHPAADHGGTPAAEQGAEPAGPKPPTQGPAMQGPRGGDLSRLLQHLPQISASDLKSGDALIVSGASEADKNKLIASNVIAGVEPIFQAAPPRQGQSLNADWSLDMAVPAQ